MNYFIFNYSTNGKYITSFLEAASLSHGDKIKTIEWFNWKFRDNPFGEAILACAEKDGKIVGCVAYGIQPFFLNGEEIKAALSFETFVHPAFQGKGIFKKLLLLAEKEALRQEIQFLLNFPNENSLPGFLKCNWSKLPKLDYWIKPKSYFSLIPYWRELKKPNISKPTISKFKSIKTIDNELSDLAFYSKTSQEYIKWRFLDFPISEKTIIEDNDSIYIFRKGIRGSISEYQYIFSNKRFSRRNLKKIINIIFSQPSNSIISFTLSKNHPSKNLLLFFGFFKVPNRINTCFKILDQRIAHSNFDDLSISAINFHTY